MLGARLGRGSFAKVKEAYHVDTFERVAIKIINLQRLRKKLMGGPATHGDEIHLLQSLNHPRIVRFIDSFEDLRRGKVYIALEYMCGGDLQHLIDSRALALGETRGVFRSLIEGLAYLHRLGIVHQDIKPSNLLINTIGAVKITDFGVAQCVPSSNSGSPKSSSSSSSSSASLPHPPCHPEDSSSAEEESSSYSESSPCVLSPHHFYNCLLYTSDAADD